MFEWKKGLDSQHISSVSYINEMEEAMDEVCEMLSIETKTFDPKSFFEKIYKYIVQKDRLIYTNVTNYIFTLNDEQFGVLLTNIDKVANYMYTNQFSVDFAQQLKRNKRECDRTQRAIIKLWDHVNLARRQFNLYYQNNSDYQRIVDEKMENAESRISKEMNMQLISLVSIFTALSFLLFGGLSSLDNILDGAKDIPILKLLITGNIWCLCMMNLIFVFMFFVAKLTKLSIKSTEDVNANFIQKYPFVWWSNWILCSSGTVFGWIYYLKRRQLLCEIENGLFNNSKAFVFTVSAVIVIVIIVTGIYILRNNGKPKKNK